MSGDLEHIRFRSTNSVVRSHPAPAGWWAVFKRTESGTPWFTEVLAWADVHRGEYTYNAQSRRFSQIAWSGIEHAPDEDERQVYTTGLIREYESPNLLAVEQHEGHGMAFVAYVYDPNRRTPLSTWLEDDLVAADAGAATSEVAA